MQSLECHLKPNKKDWGRGVPWVQSPWSPSFWTRHLVCLGSWPQDRSFGAAAVKHDGPLWSGQFSLFFHIFPSPVCVLPPLSLLTHQILSSQHVPGTWPHILITLPCHIRVFPLLSLPATPSQTVRKQPRLLKHLSHKSSSPFSYPNISGAFEKSFPSCYDTALEILKCESCVSLDGDHYHLYWISSSLPSF